MIELKDIQKRLQEEIKFSPLSRKEIADQLYMSPSTFGKYLKRAKHITIDTFANLCEILDASADEILGLKKW